MRRVFWVGVGVAITVVIVVKGRQVVARYAPASLVDQATDQVNSLGEKATGFARTFREEFRVARDAREAELLASLLAEGQPHPDDVRAARAARRDRAGEPGVDDDEDLLGYSFY
ncbi:hypothetical protein H9623_11620 [Oerskovia sp. Sa1BUA8]|uniref:Secreted protein n=1 Tax=Oerskovia douganii TaxID=2762210 RepID=A0A9D5YZW8_9CELL|nr:hypothetical protein [Oerskovia douganii]MBE7700946.1 hypothetical protein [Oerskovia douganii]